MKKLFLNGAMALALILSTIINTGTARAVFGGENGKLVYGINVDGYAQFITQNPDGSGATNVTPDNSTIADNPVWSPDGDYLYYQKGGATADTAIYMLSSDGSSETRISDYGVYGDLAVSADGAYIFFASWECLGVLDIASGESACLRNGPVNGVTSSPDGTWVVYSRYDGIYKLNLNADTETKIASPTGTTVTDWSADGTKIAYLHPETGGSHLYFIDSDGNNITAFDSDNTHANIDIHEAVFAPDSTGIAYLNELGDINIASGLTYSAPTTTIGVVGEITWLGGIDWQALNSGIPATLPDYMFTRNVYRFYSPLIQRHLYTADENEKNYIQAHFPSDIWRYEGVAFSVQEDMACAAGESVHRFYSETLKSHLYTLDENEKNYIQSHFPSDIWRYEGVAYCASKTQNPDTRPVYRFYSPLLKVHLFTVDQNEMQTIRNTFPESIWKYEGVAYYAY